MPILRKTKIQSRMIWVYILPLATVVVTFFIYQGTLSPFAKMQRAANKKWDEAIALYCRLKDWSISIDEKNLISKRGNKKWRIVGPDNNYAYVLYNGEEKESDAMKEITAILCSQLSIDAIVGRRKVDNDSVLVFLEGGTWGGFMPGDEPDFVIARLLHLGIISEDEAYYQSESVIKTKYNIAIVPTKFNDAESILLWFKNNGLSSIQIKFKTREPFVVFYDNVYFLVKKLGIPVSQSEDEGHSSLRWRFVTYSASDGHGVAIKDRPSLYLTIDFLPHKGLDIDKIISNAARVIANK